MLFSIVLIITDKYLLTHLMRNHLTVYFHERISNVVNNIFHYKQLLLTNRDKQTQLERENYLLRKRLEEHILKEKLESSAYHVLRQVDTLQNATRDYNTITARAIVDVNYLANNKILINKGSKNNVKLGQAVINQDGVIGQIETVNDSSATVTTITNPNYKIFLQRADHSKMLAQGAGSYLVVKYLTDIENTIVPGDILTTTGLDDILPANLPVAKVVNVIHEHNGFISLICSPAVDLKNIHFVSVIND